MKTNDGNSTQNVAKPFGIALLSLLFSLAAPAAPAAILTVNNTNDTGAGSLRRTIQNAHSGDTINFSVTGVITLTSGQLSVTKNLTVIGPGATGLAISGNNSSRVFEIRSNANVGITGLTIRDGRSPAGAVPGGKGEDGGGIHNSGTLTLNACAIAGNAAGSGGSSASTRGARGGNGGAGGGMFNSGTLTLKNCTLSFNSGGSGGVGHYPERSFGNRGGDGGAGGAIYNGGVLTLIGCTFGSNRGGRGLYLAGSGGHGGGIYNTNILAITACTFSDNSGGNGGPNYRGAPGTRGYGGGISTLASASATLRNSLVALNSVGAGSGPHSLVSDLSGSFISEGHNLIGQADGSIGLTTGINGDLVGSTNAPINPKLGPLQNNGGSTFTMALLGGSPALNAGDDALLAAPFNLTTDQCGVPRKFGPHVDIGAFELPLPSLTGPTLLPNGQFHFALVGQPGSNYVIQASADLVNWTALTNLGNATGTNFFNDSAAPNVHRRFYRPASP